MNNVTTIQAADAIDLGSGWDKLWAALSSTLGERFTGILTAIGVALIVMALIRFIWFRRKGERSGHGNELFVTIVLGAILAAPGLLIPLLLSGVDLMANTGYKIFNG